mmetsp:Transcript_38714/g.97508  ORF Transcript_38714/g.97508 Transcript_38714/m.97508 type:complete len:219 (+) Transcript_38714:140-796(+)
MWKWSRLLGAACSQARPPASTARFLSSAVATRPPFVLPRRGDELLLGCVSYDPAVGEIWQRMKDYFCGAGVPFDFLLFSNYEQLVRALLDQTIDVAWNGPIAHVMAHDQGIVTSLGMRDCDRDFSSLLVVPRAVAEAGLERVEQLEGWEVVTGASDSPQAHVVPLYWLEVPPAQSSYSASRTGRRRAISLASCRCSTCSSLGLGRRCTTHTGAPYRTR